MSRFNCAMFSGKFGQLGRSKASVAIMVAAVSALTSSIGFSAVSNITSLTTQMVNGTGSTVPNLSGYGASYSIFKTSNTYNLDYTGQDDEVKSVTAGSLGTYSVSKLGTVTVRRSSTGGDNDTVWYAGTATGANKSTVMLEGSAVSGFNQALSSNNLLMGADNVFSNEGNAVGDNTNVDRIDVVYNSSFAASAATAFSIMDRGPSNDHDAFKIAAITSLSNGAPSGYGPLISFSDGNWGTTNLVPTQEENIVRENDAVPSSGMHPSDSTAQAIGGVLIQTNSLVPAGTTIYGYSLFSAVANGTGSELVNWNNTTYFPAANSTSSGGGLDPVATISGLYTLNAVPEPSSFALAAIAAGGLLGRRGKRQLV